MNAVKIVRRFPLLSFYFLACLFGWSLYVVDFVTGGSGAETCPWDPWPPRWSWSAVGDGSSVGTGGAG